MKTPLFIPGHFFLDPSRLCGVGMSNVVSRVETYGGVVLSMDHGGNCLLCSKGFGCPVVATANTTWLLHDRTRGESGGLLL